MNITQLRPVPNIKFAFRRSEHQKIPFISGCYVLATFQNEILYIGKSVDLNRRFQEHLDVPEKTLPTTDGKAFWFYILEQDATLIGNLENTWLQTFQITEGRLPSLNKVDSPGQG